MSTRTGIRHILLFAIIGYGCASMPQSDMAPAAPHFKLVTYNVNVGNPAAEQVIDYLLKEDADIVCLQEVHPQWEHILKAELGSRYRHSFFKHDRGPGGGAVLSKFALKNIRVLEPSAGWFPAILTEAVTPLGDVQILNIHLSPQLNDRGAMTPSSVYYGPNIHRQELSMLAREAHPDAPLIIAGDYNEEEHQQGVRLLLNNGFQDALSLFDRHSYTWRWKVMPGIKLRKRLDHILFNEHLHCTGAYVASIKTSDHLPVAATFTIAKSEKAVKRD